MAHEVFKQIHAMSIEIALGDYGGIRDWKHQWINETYPDSKPNLSPYDRLLIAVLVNAINLVSKPPSRHLQDNRTQRACNSAARWIKSDRDDYVLDFVSVCEHFGWVPADIRKRIRQKVSGK